jgi:hypothetical protein
MTDLAAAETAAAEAEHQADEAERAAIHGVAEPDAAAVITAREKARLAQLRADAARGRQAQARANERLTALAVLGESIDQLATAAAGQGSEQLAGLLAAVASAAEAVRVAAREHNDQVADLVKRAADLQTEPHGPDGPRESSAYVAAGQDGMIRHRRTEVRLITATEADRAIGAAADGDMATAVALVSAVRQHQQRRQDHVYEIIMTGEKFDRHGDPDRWLLDRLVAGTVREVETK